VALNRENGPSKVWNFQKNEKRTQKKTQKPRFFFVKTPYDISYIPHLGKINLHNLYLSFKAFSGIIEKFLTSAFNRKIEPKNEKKRKKRLKPLENGRYLSFLPRCRRLKKSVYTIYNDHS